MKKDLSSSQTAPTFTCVICSKEKELVTVGICDHRRVCSFCSMKSRLHYNYRKCPICLQNLETIFICDFTDKTPYQTLIKKKDEFYEDEEFDKCKIYYTTIEGKEEALNLRGFNCPINNCHAESFENITSLSKHLNKVHKQFYCQYCLKENKLFLSQMRIYNKSNLEEHIKYGEYDKDTLISPPHPSCPFDDTIFYNDEQLFSHMNSAHFICQLCKDQKNIIFYPELKSLKAHFKDNHYCCHFQECLADVYVVFTKKAELLNHLITKHKVENANERLNELVFEKQNSDNIELQHETGEFNFTQYIKNLKEESENYKNNNNNRFINLNENNFNDEGIEVINKYENSNHKYNNYNNNYNNYNNYYRNNKGNNNRGRGGKYNRRGNTNYYNNSRYNNNVWNNKNNNWNKYNKGNSSLNNEEEEEKNNNSYIQNQNYINEYSNKNDKNYNKKNYYNKEGENKKYKKNIDYSFLFSFYLNIIKEIITNKIKSDNINEKNVRIPKETIFQIIVMIDKFESNDELLELKYLNLFGIDLKIHKILKSIFFSNTPENQQTFKKTLENLELKKLLIIYKYLYICSKKVDNLFYRLDLEQINEDLYEDFCERAKKQVIVMNKFEREKRNRRAFLKAEFNIGNKVLPEDKKMTETNFEKNKKEEKKDKNSIINKNNEIIENEENNNQNIKGKGKKKKGKGQFVDFNIQDYSKNK